MKVAIYVRVSTQQQTTENQLLELYEVCDRNDWTIVEEYNETVSGTKSVDDRKELHRMLQDAARKKFDVYPSAYANIWASKTQKKGKC